MALYVKWHIMTIYCGVPFFNGLGFLDPPSIRVFLLEGDLTFRPIDGEKTAPERRGNPRVGPPPGGGNPKTGMALRLRVSGAA